MRGLDPRIHVLHPAFALDKDVGGRVKPGQGGVYGWLNVHNRFC
jgi:hypothetical protein